MSGIKKFICAAVALGALGASAATYYISGELGDDSQDGLSMERAFKTFAKVFGADGQSKYGRPAFQGTVIVSNGTYAIDIPLVLNQTQMRGWTGDPKDVILDGHDYTNCCVLTYNSSLSDVTLRRGVPGDRFIHSGFRGGAAATISGSTCHMRNCIVRDCLAPSSWNRVCGAVSIVSGTICDSLVVNCRSQSTASSDGRAYGGGICLYQKDSGAYGCVVSNCSCVGNSDLYGGGIGNYFEGYDMTVSNCVVVGCACSNAAGVVRGYGGGISLTPGGQILDCHVRDCRAGDAQMTLVGRNGINHSLHRSRISGCTVENGTTRPICVGSGGSMAYATVENTLAQNVTITPTSETHGFGIYLVGSSNSVLSTVLRNCTTEGGYCSNALHFHGGSHHVVSNCVVEQCVTTSNKDQNGNTLYSGAIGSLYSHDLLVTDTIVRSNESYHASSYFSWEGGTGGTGVVMRCCYFLGNRTRGTCGIMMAGDKRTHVFDHCTFAENTGGEYFRAAGYVGLNATNWYVNACVFANISIPFYYQTGTGAVYPVSYCNVKMDLGSNYSPYTTTKTCFSTGMKYVNAAASDYRQARGSSGIDIDSSAVMPYRWMLGRKDLGTGSYELEQLGNHGIRVTHPKAQHRLSGDYPDIGCFEYYHQRGLVILFSGR